jgi:hypothetical protein
VEERYRRRGYQVAARRWRGPGGEPGGQDAEMTFEVALVDGIGRIEIVENAFMF